MRILLLAKIGRRELLQLAHPQMVSMVAVGRDPVPDEVLFSVKGFFVLYIVSTLVLTTAMMGAGLDLESAFGAVVSSINLLGPGLGEVSISFAEMTPTVNGSP